MARSFLEQLGRSFVRSAVNQVGRDSGKVVSNYLYGDKHATPRRIVTSKSSDFVDSASILKEEIYKSSQDKSRKEYLEGEMISTIKEYLEVLYSKEEKCNGESLKTIYESMNQTGGEKYWGEDYNVIERTLKTYIYEAGYEKMNNEKPYQKYSQIKCILVSILGMIPYIGIVSTIMLLYKSHQMFENNEGVCYDKMIRVLVNVPDRRCKDGYRTEYQNKLDIIHIIPNLEEKKTNRQCGWMYLGLALLLIVIRILFMNKFFI